MKPLVLGNSHPSAFMQGGFADIALAIVLFRFIWGPQPTQDELAHHLGARTSSHDGIGNNTGLTGAGAGKRAKTETTAT